MSPPSPWQTGWVRAKLPQKKSTASPPTTAQRPTPDARELRAALGLFATGVTVITSCGRRGELIGITANSFSSVSLDPPLVLFSLSRSAHSWREFLSTHYFAVNVLRRDQEALSNQFSRPLGDKWAEVEYDTWETGCPILRGTLAAFECEYEYTHDGGDHIIFVGRVIKMRAKPNGEPLLFVQGRYAGVGE